MQTPHPALLLVSPLPAGAWEGAGRGAGGEGAFRATTKPALLLHFSPLPLAGEGPGEGA
jgi:hypothetical protein